MPMRALLNGKIRRLVVCAPEGSDQEACAYFRTYYIRHAIRTIKWKITCNTLFGQELNKRSEMALVGLLIDVPAICLHCAQKSLGALGPIL